MSCDTWDVMSPGGKGDGGLPGLTRTEGRTRVARSEGRRGGVGAARVAWSEGRQRA